MYICLTKQKKCYKIWRFKLYLGFNFMVTMFKNIFKQYTYQCRNNIIIPISILKNFTTNS